MDSKDRLGDRMKAEYEYKTRMFLPPQTYTLLRVDGKAFHTYTRNCARPFDLKLMASMDEAAIALCRLCEGAKLAYVQSDEISLLLAPVGGLKAGAWFNGNIQKIASVSASIATAYFNQAQAKQSPETQARPALFDSRVWSMPNADEVYHYLLWRQLDAIRNAVTMTARAHFSHKQGHGKTSGEMREMLEQAGVCWEDLPEGALRGRVVERVALKHEGAYTHKRTGETIPFSTLRHEWRVSPAFSFAQNKDWLLSRIGNPH